MRDTLNQWLEKRQPLWQRLDELLDKARHSPARLSSDELRELAVAYRGTAGDLARVQGNPALRHLEQPLNRLVQRGHGRLYEREPTRLADIVRFFTTDFPHCFRRHWRLCALAALLFALGSVLAMITVHSHPETERFFLSSGVIANLDQGILWTDYNQARPAEASFLMTNNSRVAINAFASGVLLGVGTLLLMLSNGLFAFGGPMQVCIEHGMGWRLLGFILPHSVIELGTIFIAGGAGMLLGFTILFPGDLPRWQALRLKARESLILILGCLPLLVIAGLIEGLVSMNRAVDLPTRLLIATLTAILLTAYLGFCGRERNLNR